MGLTTSLPEHMSHLTLSIFLLTSLNLHTPANSQITTLLSFLVQHPTQPLIKTKIHPQQSATELFWTFLQPCSAFPQYYIFLLPAYLFFSNSSPVDSPTHRQSNAIKLLFQLLSPNSHSHITYGHL